jgi:DNA-binding LacI/PurR family transcriptional regulator
MEGGFQGMKRLLEFKPEQRPSAVATANDMMALGAMHAIRSRGLSIPGDITVIGFDDIAMAAHANPPLTTISPPKFEIGSWAMRKILDQIKNDTRDGKDYTIMESPLVVRESSGPYGG